MSQRRIDNALVKEVLSGNTDAFNVLMLKYQDRIQTMVSRYAEDSNSVKDITQDTFIKAYRGLPKFKGKSGFYTWLYRIAFNLAMSLKRRERPTESIDHVRQQSGREPVGDDDRPEEPMMRAERVELVRAALAALGEEHRSILVLREIDGCCYETISEILELPIGTVRSRLHRARTQLRDQLKEVLQEELG